MMKSKGAVLMGLGLLGLSVLVLQGQNGKDAAGDQNHPPILITRLYTGADGQTHAEKVPVKFSSGPAGVEMFRLMTSSGAILTRGSGGRVNDWHPAPRRQYVITLSGHGELEIAGGEKIAVGPGDIELVEDTTGKGHITKTVGTEDRVTIQIPATDLP